MTETKFVMIGTTFGMGPEITKVWSCVKCKSRYKSDTEPQDCIECEREAIRAHHMEEGLLGII